MTGSEIIKYINNRCGKKTDLKIQTSQKGPFPLRIPQSKRKYIPEQKRQYGNETTVRPFYYFRYDLIAPIRSSGHVRSHRLFCVLVVGRSVCESWPGGGVGWVGG